MIIDLILDRKDESLDYDTHNFYRMVQNYGDVGYDILNALDNGTEQQVKKALCKYIDSNDYNLTIKDYINSVEWLDISKVYKATKDCVLDYINTHKNMITTWYSHGDTYKIKLYTDEILTIDTRDESFV